MMGMSVRFFLLPLVGPSPNFLLPLTSENKIYNVQCNLVSNAELSNNYSLKVACRTQNVEQ